MQEKQRKTVKHWFLRVSMAIAVVFTASIASAAPGQAQNSGPASQQSADPPQVEPAHPDDATPASLAEKAIDLSAVLRQMQLQSFAFSLDELTKQTKTAGAEEAVGASANGAPLQQADPPAQITAAHAPGQQHVPGHQTGAAAAAASLAEKATDPSAILTQMTFEYWSTSAADDKDISSTYIFQPILPLTGNMILRPTIPFVTTGGMDGVTGVGDLFFLDLFLFNTGTATFGVGPVASLPTATSDTLGTGKWSGGPSFVYLFKGIPKNLFGILLYNQWSFAGDDDRADVNVLTFQPIYTVHFGWGYLGWTDQSASVDWNNDNALTFPLGLRIGKVWMAKTPLNLVVQPYYTIHNQGRDDNWGLKISATLILPTWLTH